MKRFCLVCQETHSFDNTWDEDCLRCIKCGSLPYKEVNQIVLKHRLENKVFYDLRNGTRSTINEAKDMVLKNKRR